MEQTCERCGAFAPVIKVARAKLCQECHGRLIVTRGRPPVGELLKSTWALLLVVGPKAVLVMAIAAIPSAIGGLFDPTTTFFLPQIAGGLITLFGTIMVVDLALQGVADVGELDLGAAAETARRRYFGYFGLQFLVGLEIALFTVLCIVPGVVRSVRFVPVGAIYLGDDCRIGEARQRSLDLSEGKWADLFVGMLVVYSPIIVVAMSAGVFAAVGEAAPEVGMILKVVEVALTYVSTVAGLAVAAFAVAAYIALEPEREWGTLRPQVEAPFEALDSDALDSPA